MRLLSIAIFSIICSLSYSQDADTLQGFSKKITGEEISYFSPLREFADVSLLTRCNGAMPVEWKAPAYTGTKERVVYEILTGHSTGTSKGERYFHLLLNDDSLLTITTSMKQKGYFEISGIGKKKCSYQYIHQEYDVNNDAFGSLFISIPAELAKKEVNFTLTGMNQNSRDWFMVFMYQRDLKVSITPTNLIHRKDKLRQVNIMIDNPTAANKQLRIESNNFSEAIALKKGFNVLNPGLFNSTDTGYFNIRLVIGNDTVDKNLYLSPARDFTFHIIHHSHLDIGYSHLQNEVEQIQTENIRSAIRWASQKNTTGLKPVWNVESLWAVENFLKSATPNEEALFAKAVKEENIALSANYANLLTGLCQPEEYEWQLQYAKHLEKKYGINIKMAMITDVPGITQTALSVYAGQKIKYLSLGPNYMENNPERGDRVGGVINEQGDNYFYWAPSSGSSEKILVGTAGKGYSYFHGVPDSRKMATWEKKLSAYMKELTEKKYAFDDIQLRYTKNADNGPVDTLLTQFVAEWNNKFSSPTLSIASVNSFFKLIEDKYSKQIPRLSGEISPYWEDGAFSTAAEEIENRRLAIKTISMEAFAKKQKGFATLEKEFYQLKKNILLFHEHTWGSWCSISDPDIFFSTEQWRIKKSYIDSAGYYFDRISKVLNFQYKPDDVYIKSNIKDFQIDEKRGGITTLILTKNKRIRPETGGYLFFEPVYAAGISPATFSTLKVKSAKLISNTAEKKELEVTGSIPAIPFIKIIYSLHKKTGRLSVTYHLQKDEERNKESLHISFPFTGNKKISYGIEPPGITFNTNQLPGSNKEFICSEKKIVLRDSENKITIFSPDICLYEIGGIIDETRVNGHKTWKKENDRTSTVFLYVLNNYWHTNYKASQSGPLNFNVDLFIE